MEKRACLVHIVNSTSQTMHFVSCWYEHGGLAPSDEWPLHLKSGDETTVRNHAQRDEGERKPGVSGLVVYSLNGADVAMAFSTPALGLSKLAVGVTSLQSRGRNVHEAMEHHFRPWMETFNAGDACFTALCEISMGLAAELTVIISEN